MSNQRANRRVWGKAFSRIFAFGLLASALACPVPVHADKAKDRAKAAFKRGAKLFESGDYVGASKEFRAAYDDSPHWKLLYNIGQCEAAAKRYGLALEAFESYMVTGGDDVPEDRQDEVRQEIRRLRDLCGDVQVEAPPGSEVYIDDFKRGTTPIAGGIPVAARKHEIKIVRQGSVLLKQEIQVRGAKTVTVRVPSDKPGAAAPAPVVAEPAPPEAEPAPAAEDEPEPALGETVVTQEEGPTNPMLVAGGVLTAVGGATMIAAVVTGAVSRVKTKELEDNCPDKQCPDSGDETLHDQAKKLSLATDIMLPTGGAIAVAGVVLIILSQRGESADEPEAQVSAVAGPGQAGVALRGRF